MAWGDKIDQFNIKKGENLVVSIDLESREYNGRWYTDVKAWKVSRLVTVLEKATSLIRKASIIRSLRAPFLDDDAIPF